MKKIAEEFVLVPEKILDELNERMKPTIQVGDTFKADGNVWEVTKIDEGGIKLLNDNYTILIDLDSHEVYQSITYDDGMYINFNILTFDEIKMVAEIIDRVTR